MIGMVLGWLRRRRQIIERELLSISQRRYVSPVFYSHYRLALPLMRQHAHGTFIDMGCGTAPFWDHIVERVDVYHGVDLWPRSERVTYVAHVQCMDMIPANTYDSGICIEVLEHVPDPFSATRSLSRILKPGGVLVLTVPHLSRLHDVPHDYYRYTSYGIRYLLEAGGLEVVSLQAKGGLLSFLGHQVSTLLLSLTWGVPGIGALAWILNKWCVTLACYHLDALLKTEETFPLGYVVVARKPGVERANNE